MRLANLGLGGLLLLGIGAIAEAAAGAEESTVREALGRQDYPWYDARKDRVVPVLTDPSSWQRGLGERVESFFKWLDRVFGRLGRVLPGGNLPGVGNVLTTA